VVIYLIGPSGVGKSTCASHAEKVLKAEHRSLDRLWSGRTNDWAYCCRQFLAAEAEEPSAQVTIIVDIGAGTQFDCTRQLEQYLTTRRQRVVLVHVPPEALLQRNDSTRSLDEFSRTEYDTRAKLYGLAAHKLEVTGKSQEGAKAYFAEYVRKTFGVVART
jgi:shikimate kinase